MHDQPKSVETTCQLCHAGEILPIEKRAVENDRRMALEQLFGRRQHLVIDLLSMVGTIFRPGWVAGKHAFRNQLPPDRVVELGMQINL